MKIMALYSCVMQKNLSLIFKLGTFHRIFFLNLFKINDLRAHCAIYRVVFVCMAIIIDCII